MASSLFPANGPSAPRVLPAHQRLAVGDHIPDGPPETACHFTVRELERPSVLVLHSDSHLFGRLADREEVAMDWAWTWHLTAEVLGGTRVVQRNNLRLTPRWLHLAYVATIVPADFVMARSHLLGLTLRVSTPPRAPVPPSTRPPERSAPRRHGHVATRVVAGSAAPSSRLK